MPDQANIRFFAGSLISQLLETDQNRNWVSNISKTPPHFNLCEPSLEQGYSTDDLRDLIRLIETLRAFELLALFAYLSADPGSGSHEREAVFDELINLIPVVPVDRPIPDENLVEYLSLSETLRSFETVALHRYTKANVNRAELVEDIIDSVEDFYEDAIGFENGVVKDCEPLCSGPTTCRMCDIRNVEEEAQP